MTATAVGAAEPPPRPTFIQELRELLNKYNMDRRSNTPSVILAEHMMRSLAAFEFTVGARDTWYRYEPETGDNPA